MGGKALPPSGKAGEKWPLCTDRCDGGPDKSPQIGWHSFCVYRLSQAFLEGLTSKD
jgi:hypothetical protein